jgi:hypothetical protein
MARDHHTRQFDRTEEAITVLFCLADDAYRLLNPRAARRYESLKRLSDSEVLTLALLQQGPYAASSPAARSCATRSVSSRACSPAWSGTLPPRSIGAFASSGAFWSPCARRSLASWPETLRR